jgi:hypothetical protein
MAKNPYPVTRTRFPELGIARIAGHIWRYVAADEAGNFDPFNGCIGASYRTKGEALADLERFAADYGCSAAAAPAEPASPTARAVAALRDIMAQTAGNYAAKSCGHDFYCSCPYDAANAALRELEA